MENIITVSQKPLMQLRLLMDNALELQVTRFMAFYTLPQSYETKTAVQERGKNIFGCDLLIKM